MLADSTVDAFVRAAATAMEADGSAVTKEHWPMGQAVVGYQSQFQLRWMATKLHVFTAVVPVEVVTVDMLLAAAVQSIEHAKAERGGLRGLQTGVAALPVLVSTVVSLEAAQTASMRPPREFAAIVLPAIVDVSAGQVHRYDGRLVWGRIYTDWLRARQDVVTTQLTGGPHR